jgi:DNA polymerase elongation subunit (family B)
MKHFEATWRDGYQFFERHYDDQLNRSNKKEVKLPYEWFEPSSKGLYTYILDETIKLEKRQGNAKQGRDHYGFCDPMYRNIRDNYWNKDGGYNTSPRIWYLDIETRVGTCSTGFPVPDKALEPITMFQLYDNKENTMIVLGTREWEREQDYTNKFDFPIKYINCENEIKLIETFLAIYNKLDPLIIYAWNGSGFDFPYIYNRIKNLGLDVDQLSNYGKVSYRETEFQGRKEFKFDADGHFFIDLMDVYKKFTFAPRSSYSLDNISEVELNENKVDHSKYSSFDDFYVHGHDEFVYYGIKDTYLIKRLDDKLNFTVLMIMIAEKMGVQLSDAMGTVKPWSQYILNRSLLNNQVMPPKTDNPDPKVVGGYVRDPNKGKHKWVVSADVNSMYPLLGMVGFNMSPETYIPKHKLPSQLRDIVLQYFNDQQEENRIGLPEQVWSTTTKLLNEHNMSLGINGAVFDKSNLGLIPQLVQDIYDGRKQAKKTMLKYEKQKIIIKDILSKQILKERQ